MPTWTIRLVRAGLLYLALGFLLGAVLLLEQAGWLTPGGSLLLPIHVECVLTGWFVQTTMGVGYWILPRYPTRPERGPDWPMAWAFGLINLGIILFAIGQAWPHCPAIPLTGRSAEAAAVLLFGLHAWPRIRPILAPKVL